MLYVLFHKNVYELQTFKPLIHTIIETEPQDFQNQIHNISFQYVTAGYQ